MNVLDLFSGIGGFSLGLERAGMRTVAFCEIEPYCRAVLKKHWPNVPIYEDVRTLTAERLRADGIAADVICGGFPCQDISIAGRGDGLDGERSGLWREYARLIGELRPRYVIVENTAALLGRGLGRVLGELSAFGYDAQWDVVPASAVGAQHIRERIWIVAHPNRDASGREHFAGDALCTSEAGAGTEQGAHGQRLRDGYGDGAQGHAADAHSLRELQPQGQQSDKWRRPGNGTHENHADTLPSGLSRRGDQGTHGRHAAYLPTRAGLAELASQFDKSYWGHQPLVGGRVHGIPNRVDRVGGLGNAVVPQIPEIIGRAILEAEKGLTP